MTAATRRRSLVRPRIHWVALGAVLVAVVLVLTVDAGIRSDVEALPPGTAVFAEDPPPGQVLDVSGGRVASQRPDGDRLGIAVVGLPDASATANALALLSDEGVAVTWFAPARTLAGRASTVRALLDAGHELGLTGYDGTDLRALPEWRQRLHLSLAQAVLAARFDTSTSLLLLPATATLAEVDAAAVAAAAVAAGRGQLLVAGTGFDEAQGGDVAVVVATDDLAADLGALLNRAARADLAPGTVSAVALLDPPDANRPAGRWAGLNARLALATASFAGGITTALRWSTVPLVAVVVGRLVLTTAGALLHARAGHRSARDGDGPGWHGTVSVVVPAFNERAGIEATLRSILASTCAEARDLEVVVVDDGSTDGTGDVVERLALPRVRLLRQENAGKPAALNAGIAASKGDALVLVDGDTVFEPETVERLVEAFTDPRTGAVSGNAKVLNRRRLLGLLQHVEYVLGFNLDRRFLDRAGAIITIPGAVGAFRSEVLAAVGGVSDETIAEDTDLTIAVARAGWRVVYRERAVAWTEAPSRLVDLWRQRYRWAYGTMQAIWKHRGAFRERSAIGLVGLPYAVVFQVALAVIGPLIDVAAVHALVTGSTPVLTAWLVFTGAQVLLAAFALRLDRERLRAAWVVPLQQLLYRQLMYLVVIQALTSAAAGARLRWHKLHRVGIDPATLAAGRDGRPVRP